MFYVPLHISERMMSLESHICLLHQLQVLQHKHELSFRKLNRENKMFQKIKCPFPVIIIAVKKLLFIICISSKHLGHLLFIDTHQWIHEQHVLINYRVTLSNQIKHINQSEMKLIRFILSIKKLVKFHLYIHQV